MVPAAKKEVGSVRLNYNAHGKKSRKGQYNFTMIPQQKKKKAKVQY
jgi:hypothetical protein